MRHYVIWALLAALALAGCGGSVEPTTPLTSAQETSLTILEGSGGTIAVEVSGDVAFNPISGRFTGRDLYFYGGVAPGATFARQEVMIYLPMTVAVGTYDAVETGITFTVTEGNNFLGVATNPTGTFTLTEVGETLAGELNFSDAGLTVAGTFSDVPVEGMTTSQGEESQAEATTETASVPPLPDNPGEGTSIQVSGFYEYTPLIVLHGMARTIHLPIDGEPFPDTTIILMFAEAFETRTYDPSVDLRGVAVTLENQTYVPRAEGQIVLTETGETLSGQMSLMITLQWGEPPLFIVGYFNDVPVRE